MQPNNRSERSKALLNFMLLFLLCAGIIVTTVFYSTKVPLSQNKQLMEYKNSQVIKEELKSDFTERFIVISKMIDDLGNKSKAEITSYSIEIDKQITALGKLLPEGKDEDNSLYLLIVKNLSFYKDAKATVKDGIETDAADKKLAETIAALQIQNNQLFKDLDDCRRTRPKN